MRRNLIRTGLAAVLAFAGGTAMALPDDTGGEQETETEVEIGDPAPPVEDGGGGGSGSDSDSDGGGGSSGRRGRAAHDVRVKLGIAQKRSATPLAKVRVKNRGTSFETGVQVRLLADSENGEELWSGTADIAPRRSARFRFRVAPPAGATTLVATASLDGAADERPDDNVARASLGRGGSAAARAIGASIYAANCASCHGTDARGTTLGPNIRRESRGEIFDALREGEDGMPTFPGLSLRDAGYLAAFLQNPEAAAPPAPPPPPPPPPPPGTAPTYAGQVKAILDANCASCHGAVGPMAGIRLDTYAGASTNAARALAAIQAGRMPPAGPLSAADRQVVQDWILGGKQP